MPVNRIPTSLLFAALGCASCAAAAVTAAGLSAPAATRPAHLQVPDQASLKRAQTQVREAYGRELADRSPEGRLGLAGRLLTAGRSEGEVAPVRYVELSLARDLAAGAGDLTLAFECCDELAARYGFDPMQSKLDLAGAATTALGDAAVRPLLQLSDDAADAKRFALASKAAALAETAATRARDGGAVAVAREQARAVENRQRSLRAAEAARRRLLDARDDPGANLLLGKYLCADEHRWTDGLPLLSKAPSQKLRAVAGQDLRGAADPKTMTAIGDAWLDLSETDHSFPQETARGRAALWYRRALPRLSGIERERVRNRIRKLFGEMAPNVGMDKSEWKVLCWDGKKWAATSRDKMLLRRSALGLTAKNSTGTYVRAFLVYDFPLEGDFDAAIEVEGGCNVIFEAADLSDSLAYCPIPDDLGSHSLHMSRQRGELRGTMDGKPVEVKQYQVRRGGPGYFGLAIPSNATVVIRHLSIM